MRSQATVFFFAAGLAAAVPAQVVLPPAAAQQTGNALHTELSLGGRLQQGFRAADLAPNSATLTALRLRASRYPSAAALEFPAKSFSSFAVDVHLLSTPLPLNLSFAANMGPTVSVYRGSITLPALPAGPRDGTPAPWSIRVPFSTPVVVDPRVHTTVVIDVTATGPSSFDAYPVDAERIPSVTASFGPRRTNLLEASFGAIGTLRLSSCYATGLMVVALGRSNTMLTPGGPALPLDLTPYGATGETLLVSPDVPVPAFRGRFYGNGKGVWPVCSTVYDVTIPALTAPALLGQQLFAQGVVLDYSNPLGIALTNGVDVVFGRSPVYWSDSIYGQLGGTSGYPIAPAIVQFEGTFR